MILARANIYEFAPYTWQMPPSRTRSCVGTGSWWPRSSMVPRHVDRLADLK